MASDQFNLSMVFKRTTNWDFEEIIVTPRMLRTLAMVDGQKSIALIAEMVSLPYEQLFEDLQQLHFLKLITLAVQQPAEPAQTHMHVVKKLHYRGTEIEFDKGYIPRGNIVTKTKQEHYRGTSYEVAVSS